MSEVDPFAYLDVRPSKSGSMRIDADISWDELNGIAASLNSEIGGHADVSTRTEAWAGPYDLYFTIINTALAAIGTGTGVVSLLMQFARRHPERPFRIHIDNSRTIIINGVDRVSIEDEQAIENLFSANDKRPEDSDWENPGPGA